jgi:hypothetical protein
MQHSVAATPPLYPFRLSIADVLLLTVFSRLMSNTRIITLTLAILSMSTTPHTSKKKHTTIELTINRHFWASVFVNSYNILSTRNERTMYRSGGGGKGTGMEGLGGEIKIDAYTYDGIDPALEDCCRREVESNRKYNALTSTLRRHDVSALAERRRRNLIRTAEFDGCRCCYDPTGDGGEYRALVDLKAERQRDNINKGEQGDYEAGKEHNEFDRSAATTSERQEKTTTDDADGSDGDDDEFDYLLDEDLPDEDGELKAIEDRRRAELEYEMMLRQFAQQHGYGVHRQLHPLRVLKAAGLTGRGTPPFVVVHLVDPDSRASATLDYFLETILSKENPGTVFLRSGGRSTLLMDSGLARKALPSTVTNPDRDMPALVAVRDGVAVNARPRLEGLMKYGKAEVEVDTLAVREWLEDCGVLIKQPPRMEDLCFIRPEEQALMDSAFVAKSKSSTIEEERYYCGVDGCNKSFKHEHVGIQTSEQSGLVVTEETILNGDC